MAHSSEKWLLKPCGFFLTESVAFIKQGVQLISKPGQLMDSNVTPDYARCRFAARARQRGKFSEKQPIF